MQQIQPDWNVIVVGGGPAGLAAAISAREAGAADVLLLERQDDLGGILNQCIHNGFGLHHFKQELTGPEYAERFITALPGSGVQVLCGAMVLRLEPAGDLDGCYATMQGAANGGPPPAADGGGAGNTLPPAPAKGNAPGSIHPSPAAATPPCGASGAANGRAATVHVIHPTHGYLQLGAKAVVLAMGCRERTRGAIGIPGTRPAGVFTAGAAQLYMNIEGFRVGKRAVVLGSGDIGLIMARRMTLEGAKVLGVYELMPYSGGLARNKVQCLDDYGIPLHLSHTITEIRGDKRVEQVVVQQVDDTLQPIPGTEQVLDCDTVLLSVGLIPENELSRNAGLAMDKRTGGPVVYENMETSAPGVFACGNVAHVHDLVDFVTAESQRAGTAAAKYCLAAPGSGSPAIQLQNGTGVGYTVPQIIRKKYVENSVDIFFRVRQVYHNATVELASEDQVLASFKRQHMAPGEMERVTLPAALLQAVQAGTAELRVHEG